MTDLHERVLAWYDEHSRSLPWREATASPWAVVVSEFMLQQTPVARVLPTYERWMQLWPTPAELAAASSGDAIRAWGRLGYPRRALRLHQVATAIVVKHGGRVPTSREELRALPGVGDYTAAAVASFAFGQRHVVLDTNVRRVFARALAGLEFPANSVTKAERELATGRLPADAATATRWAVAVMELGALVCTAAAPKCGGCPISDRCVWRSIGYPAYDGPPRRRQAFAGTDRQCRGKLLHVLVESPGSVHRSRLDVVWRDDDQRERCLTGLVNDGLIARLADETYGLP